MYDLARFTLRDMTECAAALRKMGAGASGLDEIADRVVKYFFTGVGDSRTGRHACALVRFFTTQAYGELDDDDRRSAQESLGCPPRSPAMKCLRLLATAGERPEWNDRRCSKRHKAIPLAGPQFAERFPMVAQLFTQFGLRFEMAQDPDADLLMDWEEKTYNVFHVPDARGSFIVPAQEEFVLPCGIRSVLGFGGVLPCKNLFAVILFSKFRIPRETAEFFKTLAVSVKLSALPFAGKAGPPRTPDRAGGGAQAGMRVVADAPWRRTQVTALEQLLEVHEQTVIADSIARGRAEEALQESESSFRKVVESAWDLIVTFTREGIITSLNPAFETMTKWAPSEWIGKRLAHLLDQEDVPVAMELFRHIVTNRSPLTWSLKIRTKEGGFVTGEFVGVPQIENGKVAGVLGIARDITERRAVEDALRHSEEQLRSVVQSTKDAILTIDGNGCLTFWNCGAADMFGYSAQEVIGEPVTIIIPERFREAHRQGVARARAAGGLTVSGNMFELVGLRKDGSEFPLEFSLAAWTGKSGLFFTGIVRDITDRKHGEAALRAGAERFLKQQSALISLTQSKALQGLDLEATLQQITEVAAQTLAVERVSIWRYADDHQSIRCVDLYEISSGRHTSGMELRADAFPGYFRALGATEIIAADDAHQDSRTREFSDSYLTRFGINSMMDVPIYLFGKLEGVLCHEHVGPQRQWVQDEQMFAMAIANLISLAYEQCERKRAEEQLQNTLDRVRTLSRRLDVIREEERTRIARELHDELGVGLTCLKIDLSQLQARGKKGPPAGRRRADRQIRSMVEFLDTTIQAVQRIVTELRPAILDDLGLVAAIEWQTQDFERRTGILCTLRVAAQEDVKVDPERATVVFRIFQEALTNVARHAGATAVTIRLNEDEGALLLEVRDNGRGIAEDKILDVRSLGLLGMRERAALFGGRLTVTGRPGEGTTVALRLPTPPAV